MLQCNFEFENLIIALTCGSQIFFVTKNKILKRVFFDPILEDDKKVIFSAFDTAISESMVSMPDKILGERIEDRITQITFSALGQETPINEKKKWDPDCKKEKK